MVKQNIDSGKTDVNILWTNNFSVLLTYWYELLPYGYMSNTRKSNALTRLAFVVGFGLLINRISGGHHDSVLFVVSVLLAVILTVVFLSRKKHKNTEENFQGYDEIQTVVLPNEVKKLTENPREPKEIFDKDQNSFNRATTNVSLDASDANLQWLAGADADTNDGLHRTLNTIESKNT